MSDSKPKTTAIQFDIRDGRHRYEPCPKCGERWSMGVGIKLGFARIECAGCYFEGPDVEFNIRDPLSADQAAFDAWNSLPREDKSNAR